MKISDLIIDKEFESVIPPLEKQEFEFLEESIVKEGQVHHPLVVWNNTIIDGHHRYKILKKHPDIKYSITEKNFNKRPEAISWICLNQLGRRNLSDIQKTILMGRRYSAEKESKGSADRIKRKTDTDFPVGQNDPQGNKKRSEAHRTAIKIAEEMNTSPKTVRRAEEFVNGMDAAEEVLPGIAKEIVSGKIKPNKADVRAIAKAPAEERKQMAKNLYKELTPEEKERRKKKRKLSKSIEILDQTHMPSPDNKIQPEDMLMTFSSEAEKFVRSMDFCFDYFPQLLTEPEYFEQVKKVIQPVKDYIKTLEENKPSNNISIAK